MSDSWKGRSALAAAAVAAALFVPQGASAESIALSVDTSASIQQTLNAPCVIGESSCQNPETLPFTVVAPSLESATVLSADAGDRIVIDAETNRIDIALSDAELAARKADFKAPPYKSTRGTLYKYIKNVKTASEGCVTDE